MLATVAIEIALALYALAKYKLSLITKLIITTLVMLATFQVSEYFVCTGAAGNTSAWSRLGFAAITVLPPLGLHILHLAAKKPGRRLVFLAYASMAAFIGFFILYSGAFTGHQCTGNYVIFQVAEKAGGLFGLYYYGWLATSLTLGALWADQLMHKGKKARQILLSVRALMIGWLIFLVPTALAYSVAPEARQAIPSVMCGFAVLYALILTLVVLPRVGRLKPRA